MDILLLILRLVLAGLLYAFLGVVLVMLWRDLRETVVERSSARPQGRLVVLGPGRAETGEPPSERTYPLQPVMSIGRSPSNTVVIGDTYASSQHALLTWREGHWWLTDQDSRNGTVVNGERVEEPVLVTTGDVITVGETRLKLEIDDTV
jgi:pSer/pThr/pTyr-binding forkhead associated (FHA) protein